MLKLAAFAALVGLASASCPNQCSGHGKCGPNDKCICFKSSGASVPSRFSYTGADCSLRTCPYGIAPDAISTSMPAVSPITFIPAATGSKEKLRVIFNPFSRSASFLKRRSDVTIHVKVMSVSSDPNIIGSFAWKLEEDVYFQQETNIASSTTEGTARGLTYMMGSTAVNTGLYIFFEGTLKGGKSLLQADSEVNLNDYYTFTLSYNDGSNFDLGDANTAHQEKECSGRGRCDQASGKCECHVGYTGIACERTICPNDCSGHGSCQSQARFVTDSGILIAGTSTVATYAGGYDRLKEFGCKCDVGYRGPDCSLIECPSYLDPLGGDGGAQGRDCSGRGVCDYSTGLCVCNKGYHSEACELQTVFA